MRVRGWIILVVGMIFAASILAEDSKAPVQPSDEQIKQLIVGKWEGMDPATGATGTIRYSKDGTFSAEGSATIGNKKIEVRAEGKWSVSKGTLVCTVSKSSRPRLIPVGTDVKEVVHAIDEKSIRFTREMEQERTRTRVKE